VNWGIGFLLLSMLLSTAFSPYTDFSNKALEDWLKVLVFYALVMTSVRDERELKILVVAFVAITTLYELHSLREYLNGRGVYRMGTWRMVGVDATMCDPNAFSATVNYGIPMLFPLVVLAKKRWHYLGVLALFGLACTCILLTGSRTAFVGLCFQLVVLGLFSKHRWKIIPLLILIPPIAWTLLPEDRQNRYLTLIDPSYGPANAEGSAKGRLTGFNNGIKLWQSYPLFGVGPACHGIAIGHGFRSHNLYGQVLGDCGTLGAIALLCLVGGYFLNFAETARLRSCLPRDPDVGFLHAVSAAVAFTCVLLLLFGWGGHNLLRYHWLWYAAFQASALRFLRQRAASAAYCAYPESARTQVSGSTASADNPDWGGLPT